MASSRVPDNLPAYNPNKSTLAFGNRALPKIRRELLSHDTEVVQQALLLLDDLLHKPENITTAINEGLVKSLSLLLAHNDPVVKYRACTCLKLIGCHSLGRTAFLKLNIINDLSKLFTDDNSTVRLNSLHAVEVCARTKEGVQGLLDNNLIPLLVDRLLIEKEQELQIAILDALHWCLMADSNPGLECRAIERLQPFLSCGKPDIIWRVGKCLYDLNVLHSGKRTSCDCRLVNDLVPLLSHKHHLVRTHIAGVLMSIAVITEGKYAVLEADGLKELVTLLLDNDPTVSLNAIKGITLLAEAPKGKKELQNTLEQVQQLFHSDDPVISKAAKTAYSTITWKP